VDASSLRRIFEDFAGVTRYKAFVRALNLAPMSLIRLRFWQEELWLSFVKAYPHLPVDFGGTREAFRICEVHDRELVKDLVHAPAGQIQRTYTQSPNSGFPDFPKDFANFPYSGWGVDPLEWPGAGTYLMEIWFCPECRRLRAAWEEEHAEQNAAADRGNGN
jgi:hypothetical protein